MKQIQHTEEAPAEPFVCFDNPNIRHHGFQVQMSFSFPSYVLIVCMYLLYSIVATCFSSEGTVLKVEVKADSFVAPVFTHNPALEQNKSFVNPSQNI